LDEPADVGFVVHRQHAAGAARRQAAVPQRGGRLRQLHAAEGRVEPFPRLLLEVTLASHRIAPPVPFPAPGAATAARGGLASAPATGSARCRRAMLSGPALPLASGPPVIPRRRRRFPASGPPPRRDRR